MSMYPRDPNHTIRFNVEDEKYNKFLKGKHATVSRITLLNPVYNSTESNRMSKHIDTHARTH
uniref:Uncharacterized protein n=1 Tax=Anguilla anguilla TaxID=7936 RepID=A0A0E9X0S6_ANGAN